MWSETKFAKAKFPDAFSPTQIFPDPRPWPEFHKSLVLSSSQKKALVFWSKMFVDHMVLLYLNLGTCNDLYAEMNPDILHIPDIDKNKVKLSSSYFRYLQKTTLKLASEWNEFHQEVKQDFKEPQSDLERLRLLWNSTYNCKHYVRNLIERGFTMGNIDKSLIHGMLFELYYLRARIENSIQDWQEAAMFMDDIALHLVIAAQYLDSGIFSREQRQFIQKLLALSEESFQIRNQFIKSRKIKVDSLRKCIEFSDIEHEFFMLQLQMKLDSKMHPLLISHSLEESRYERERLQELLDNL